VWRRENLEIWHEIHRFGYAHTAVLLCKLWASFLKEIDVPFRLFQECVIHRQLAKMYLRELGMGIALPASGDVSLKPHFLFNLRRCVLEKGKG
jgi:hypothetical protein